MKWAIQLTAAPQQTNFHFILNCSLRMGNSIEMKLFERFAAPAIIQKFYFWFDGGWVNERNEEKLKVWWMKWMSEKAGGPGGGSQSTQSFLLNLFSWRWKKTNGRKVGWWRVEQQPNQSTKLHFSWRWKRNEKFCWSWFVEWVKSYYNSK